MQQVSIKNSIGQTGQPALYTSSFLKDSRTDIKDELPICVSTKSLIWIRRQLIEEGDEGQKMFVSAFNSLREGDCSMEEWRFSLAL
jgi:hypothetical protein